jgi:hypothetical protein
VNAQVLGVPLRTILAVLVAGVAGELANALAIALAFPDQSFFDLAASPGRVAVAVAVAALLPVIGTKFAHGPRVLLSIFALTVIPSVLAKLVFGAGADWGVVLGLNAIYAGVALLAFRLVMVGGK